MSRLWTTRRALLASLGGTAATLAAFLPWRPPARAAGAPRRFVIAYSGNGTIRESFEPGPDFELSPILSPFEPHREDLVVVDGLSLWAGGAAGNEHHMAFGCLLTGEHLVEAQFFDLEGNYYGSHGGPTVDQVIADGLNAQTAFHSLQLGVQSGKDYGSTSMSKLSARGPRELLHPEIDPFRLFDRVFGGSRSADELATIRRQKSSVLDYARHQLDDLTPKLSREEQVRLQAHMDAVRSIERRMQLPVPECEPFEPGAPFDIWANDNFPQVAELQLDLLATALACDQTRVASFMFSESTSQTIYNWLGVSGGHHDISHAGDSDELARGDMVAINTWVAEQLSRFASKLKELPDVAGSVYDNTLVVWVNDFNKGNEHTMTGVPFVMLGGAGGAVRGGQYLVYEGSRWHNDFLRTLCHAMGVPVKAFGAPEANGRLLEGVLG